MSCAGIAVLSVVDAGFIFSGSVGSGILMQRDLMSGEWSPPVACGLTGVGFGFLLGAAVQELIIFFPDEKSIATFCSTGLNLGTQSDVTIGVGRDFEAGFGLSKDGSSATMSFAYSKGAFGSLALKGAVVAPRKAINTLFYEVKNPELDILAGKVSFPEQKVTLWKDVVEKLDKLAQGLTELPGDDVKEKQRLESARIVANEVADELHKSDGDVDVVEVDAQTEAAKESSLA